MSNASNDSQIEYWNGVVGERWVKLNALLDRSLEKISQSVLAFAAAKPGERALDIGCGCGTATFALAKAVGGSGDVTGVDISRPMLEFARSRGAGVNFLEADAAVHLFHPTHDLVFSRFGVMFFADPYAAFANIRKAQAPHGRLAFVCWREVKENLWASAPYAAAKHLLPEQAPSDPHAPGPFAFADAARVKDILTKAGYRDIRVERLDSVVWMGDAPEDAAQQSLNIGPLAFAARELDKETRAKIKAVVVSAMEKFRGPGGVAPPASCWLVGAKA